MNPAPPPPFPPPLNAPNLPPHLLNARFYCPTFNSYLPSNVSIFYFIYIQNQQSPPRNFNSNQFNINNDINNNINNNINNDINNDINNNIDLKNKEIAIVSAEPKLKDLQAQVTKMVPTTLQVKRSILKNGKSDQILENFINDINNL